MTVTLPRTPSCPVCGRELNSSAIASRESIAVCFTCTDPPYNRWEETLKALENPELQTTKSHRIGITFWTPHNPRSVAADAFLASSIGVAPAERY